MAPSSNRCKGMAKTRKRLRTSMGISIDCMTPRKLVKDKLITHARNEDYEESLRELSTDLPTEGQLVNIKLSGIGGPNYLGRTVSMKGGLRHGVSSRKTNGHTTQDMFMPAADTHYDHALHSSISTMTQGELQYMLGQHLIWNDIPGDEFLSYSMDPLFLVYHALTRHDKNQGNVTIQFLDRRRATDMKGRPAVFYHALDLYDTFEVPTWAGWYSRSKGNLYPRKFTQEFLTHGTVATSDSRFHQAKMEDLIRDGFYDIFPAFAIPAGHVRAELYSGQVMMRKAGYPAPASAAFGPNPRLYSYDQCARSIPFTVEFLRNVQRLTLLFGGERRKDQRHLKEPHLHVFLCFLTFQKRPERDSVFLEWIKAHYKRKHPRSLDMPHVLICSQATDVTDLYDDGDGGVRPDYTRVANNLPGVMQYLDLVRDAIFAFELTPLPDNKIWSRNGVWKREKHKHDLEKTFADEDAELGKDAWFSLKWEETPQYQAIERKKKRKEEDLQAKKTASGATRKAGDKESRREDRMRQTQQRRQAVLVEKVRAREAKAKKIEMTKMRGPGGASSGGRKRGTSSMRSAGRIPGHGGNVVGVLPVDNASTQR